MAIRYKHNSIRLIINNISERMSLGKLYKIHHFTSEFLKASSRDFTSGLISPEVTMPDNASS